MYKRIISLLLFTALLTLPLPFGAAAESAQIDVQVTVQENAIHLSGNLNAAPENEFVTVQLLSGNSKATTAAAAEQDILHFGVCKAEENGAFAYDFSVSSLSGGEYLYIKCGSREYFAPLVKRTETVQIYVAPSGNDSAAGTPDAPLKTMEGARKAAAKIDKTEKQVEVIFAGGEYFQQGSVRFTAADSGSKDTPVIYKAADGEKPVFTVSKKLNAAGFTAVTDADTLLRLPEEAREKVLQLDLTKSGITAADVELYSRTSNLLNERGMLLNGKPQRIARYPNTGFLRVGLLNVVTAGSKTEPCVFKWDNDRISRWSTADNLWLEGYFEVEYRADTAKNCSVDAAKKQITMGESECGISYKTRWRAINLLEEIDIPGEWFVDKNSMTLYYYPPRDFDKTSDELRFTVNSSGASIDQMIVLGSTENICFEGLEFRDKYYGDVVRSTGKVNGITFRNCSFVNTACAINLDGKNLTVEGCDFRNLQGCAARLSDQGAIHTLTPSGITFTNNYIYNTDLGSAPVFVGGVGARIANNLIHRMDDGGLLLGSIDPQQRIAECTAENNEIYNGLREKGDMSMIYMGRSWYSPGIEVNRNYIHDFGIHEHLDWFSNPTYGIFADDTHSNASFTGNIINANNKDKTYGIVLGGGSNLDVEGNTIIHTSRGADFNDRTNSGSITTYGAYTAMLAAYNDGLKYDQGIWLTKYPQVNKIMTDITADGKHIPKNEKLIGNLFFDNSKNFNIATRNKQNGQESGNVTAADDSIFVNAAANDWRVTAAAKAAQGIGAGVLDESFDMSSIGLTRTLSMTYEPVRLQYPLQGDYPKASALTLAWEDAAPADEYFYEIATDEAFANVVKSGTVYENVADVSGLTKGATYYWRVTARNLSKDYGKSWKSETGTFRTDREIVTVQSFQENAAGKAELTYTIDGTDVQNADVLIAVKSGDRVIAADVFSDSITSGQQNTFTKQLNIAVKPEYTVECFALSSIRDLTPIDRKEQLILKR